MAIYLYVAGNPEDCHACGRSLTGVSQGINGGVGNMSTAKSNSESHWGGTAGDSFRTRVGAMSKGAGEGVITLPALQKPSTSWATI